VGISSVRAEKCTRVREQRKERLSRVELSKLVSALEGNETLRNLALVSRRYTRIFYCYIDRWMLKNKQRREMASAKALVKDVVSELTDALKELKGADEDDLGELAGKLDNVSEKADEAASRLHKADQALSGEGAEDQTQEQEVGEGPEEAGQDEE
jgi:hypothetical protein